MAVLSLKNDEIVRAVLQVMGVGRTAANMDAPTEADVRQIIRDGLRRFYFPTIGDFVYQWRWLEKYHPISIVAKFSTGTVAVSGGTVTLTGGVWPALIVDYFIRVSGHVLFVTTRTDDTHVVVSNTQLSVAAGTAFEACCFRYGLPSDFVEWLGGLVYADGSESGILSRSSEPEIRLRYAVGQGLSSRTTHYDITSTPDAAEMQIVLWPVPVPDAFMAGTYLSVPDDNLPADLTVPGVVAQVSPIYAKAVMEAILAEAEAYNDAGAGLHEAKFEVALAAAIAHDKSVGGAYDFSHNLGDYKGVGQVASEIDFDSQL
jgi:hypothetical protein